MRCFNLIYKGVEITDANEQRNIILKHECHVRACYEDPKFWNRFYDLARSFNYHPFVDTKSMNCVKYQCRKGDLTQKCPVPFLTNDEIGWLLYLTIIEGERCDHKNL